MLLTHEKLQARFDLALTQIDQLLAPPSASPGASPRPSASLSVVTVNSLVQLALGDMNGILFVATRAATTVPPPVQIARPTVAPTVAPTPVRTSTPTQPVKTPSPAPSPTAKPTATR